MIKLLTEKYAQEYMDLRREALLDSPLAFASSPEDDFFTDIDELKDYLRQKPEAVILGAFTDRLAGSVGLYRDRHIKAGHKAHLWGTYVRPAERGKGLGKQLVQAVIAHARTLPGIDAVHLSVSGEAAAARYLYESMGFSIWGTEPDALRAGGRSTDEQHMRLQL
jgi:RimJ/RimL family protein N-acetyltransferase